MSAPNATPVHPVTGKAWTTTTKTIRTTTEIGPRWCVTVQMVPSFSATEVTEAEVSK